MFLKLMVIGFFLGIRMVNGGKFWMLVLYYFNGDCINFFIRDEIKC